MSLLFFYYRRDSLGMCVCEGVWLCVCVRYKDMYVGGVGGVHM